MTTAKKVAYIVELSMQYRSGVKKYNTAARKLSKVENKALKILNTLSSEDKLLYEKQLRKSVWL